MFSFILNQPNNTQQITDAPYTDDEHFTGEAIQGDTALILRVKELNALIEYSTDAAA